MTMYKFQRSVAAIHSTFFIFLSVTVGSLQADIIARYGNAFMNDGAGARALAMGGSYVSLSDDAWSIFWNPAGLLKNPLTWSFWIWLGCQVVFDDVEELDFVGPFEVLGVWSLLDESRI